MQGTCKDKIEASRDVCHADYRQNVALSNVKAGYTLLCKHAVTLVLVPLSAVLLVRVLWHCAHAHMG